MGDGTIVDSMIHDGLWDSFHNIHMGLTGEHVVRDVPRHARGAGPLRRREPSQGRAGDAPRLVQGRDPAGLDSAEEGRPDRHRSRRVDPRRHDGRVARPAEAGVQEGRHRDGRQRAGRQRRRRRARRDGGRRRARQLGLTPLARIVGYATSGLEPKLVMMTPVEAVQEAAQEDRLGDRRRRPGRAERGVRRPGRRGHARARPRPRARQRARRRGRARPSDRRQRRARADDAALRAEAARRQARHRHALPRRRQRRRDGYRACLRSSTKLQHEGHEGHEEKRRARRGLW